ncbi:hypothetical protein, partial [Neobacillus drentensis]|uniref:hypothetical protein n=1 Tax=Neobacillus drentensis TaxID=220684 RepID=UPI003000690B
MVLKLDIEHLLSQAKENGVVGFLDNNPVGKKGPKGKPSSSTGTSGSTGSGTSGSSGSSSTGTGSGSS